LYQRIVAVAIWDTTREHPTLIKIVASGASMVRLKNGDVYYTHMIQERTLRSSGKEDYGRKLFALAPPTFPTRVVALKLIDSSSTAL
jgi:hypothetical protein|tara:strand:- start:459 stop:719 length:261 start_codon:yes stop_codon:yes gene_type:complete